MSHRFDVCLLVAMRSLISTSMILKVDVFVDEGDVVLVQLTSSFAVLLG